MFRKKYRGWLNEEIFPECNLWDHAFGISHASSCTSGQGLAVLILNPPKNTAKNSSDDI
jgi:hypothetical protein